MRRLENCPPIQQSTLQEFVDNLNNEGLQKLLNRINEKYVYWDKVKHMTYENFSPEKIWQALKVKRFGNSNFISFGGHHFLWNMNNAIQGYLHFLDMNIGGSLESTSIVSKEDKNRYLISSLMEEAIASSQIEGAVTTRKKAKEMLRKKQKPTDASEQMIDNNYATIQKIVEIKSEPLNNQNLLALHKLLTSNTMPAPEEEGFFRATDDVLIHDTQTGAVVHQPPPVKDLDNFLNDLYSFFNTNDENKFIHPLIKASIIHFMLGYIHPFADGNGRTARALFYWYLLKSGYWLTEYLSISRLILRAKAQYARAFQYTEIDDHDMTYFIIFNLKAIKLSFDELRSYIQRKNQEKMKLSSFIKLNDVSYKQAIVLEWFYRESSLLLTIKEAETRLAVSDVSARKYLLALADKGYLSMVQLNKKSFGFIKSDVFDQLVANKSKNHKSAKSVKNINKTQQTLFTLN